MDKGNISMKRLEILEFILERLRMFIKKNGFKNLK